MAGDYSRTTFNPAKHFSSVLMQQGRVQLDADWNEQNGITLHHLRALAADLIGRHGGAGNGFRIDVAMEDGKQVDYDFSIAPGHYYVDGLLCENDAVTPVRYSRQVDHPPESEPLEASHTYIVYLEAWEQEVTALQDDSIREVALGGPDTTTRLRVVWRVRVLDPEDHEWDPDHPDELLDRLRPFLSSARLAAFVAEGTTPDDPCSISPGAPYRGLENQLYRVEVHRGGDLGAATFKWSRDNATAAFAVTGVHDSMLTLESLGPDERRSVRPGDWVEVVDDDTVLDGLVPELLQVQQVDPGAWRVTLPEGVDVDLDRHPLLRRWDHGQDPEHELTDGAIAVREGEPIALEDGLEIQFESAGDSHYQAGDYWQIPARTATGTIDWPGAHDAPVYRGPLAVRRHTAPLHLIELDGGGSVSLVRSYRRTIQPVAVAD
jgi:hypothetical protein